MFINLDAGGQVRALSVTCIRSPLSRSVFVSEAAVIVRRVPLVRTMQTVHCAAC